MTLDPLLDALKTETRSLHAQLEARVDILSRLKSPQAYKQLLTSFYGFYAPVEASLAEHKLQFVGLDIAPRLKVPLLLDDLRYWDVHVESVPLASVLPQITSASESLGCLYVVEGATLGSQIIKRLLVEHLGVASENGGAFFNAYGDRVRGMWEEFRQKLSQFACMYPHERGAIIAAAQETFTKLGAWFEQTLDRSVS